MWDPTAKREPIVRELDCSRDEHGIAHGTITLRPWSTRERLAYQDELTASLRIAVDEQSGAKLSRVRISAMQLAHVRLTIVGCGGFPDVDGQPFDFGNVEHLLELDEETFEEVHRLALEVQPAPTGGTKAPQDRKAPKPSRAVGEPDDDFAGSDDDPSRTR